MDSVEQLENLNHAIATAGLNPTAIKLPVERQVIANGIRLHVLDWGAPDGAPIVFLHGGSLTAHTWDLVCVMLSDRYRCIAVDLRGHGDSEWAADIDYRYETIQADIEGLIKQLSIDSPVVIGMSYGGLVAISLAGEPDASLSGLVLIDSGPVLHVEAATEIVEFTRHDQEMDSVEDFVDRAMRQNANRRPELLRRNLLHNLRQLPNGRWTWKWDWRRHENYDLVRMRDQQALLWQKVAEINCPTLIVRGGRSRIFLQEDGEALAAAIPNSSFVVVPNAGHNVQGSNARGLLDVLEPFLVDRFAGWSR